MKKKIVPVIAVIILIFVLGAGYAGKIIYDHYSYSNEHADLTSYFGVTDEADVPVVLENAICDDWHARIIDGTYYIKFSDVQYLNDRFYYGKEDGTLVYTTPTTTITAALDATSYSVSDGSGEDLGYVIARLENDTLYVAIDYVKKYTNFYYATYTNPNHMQITTEWGEQTTATIKKATKLRYRGGVKSKILEDLSAGDSVVVLKELEDWSKVKTADSYIGYVENKFLKDKTTAQAVPVTDYTEPEYTSISMDGKVNLAWHSIGAVAGNATFASATADTKNLNVISPTWFQMSDGEGGIVSYASSDYVTSAHNAGMQVWPTLDNFNNAYFASGGEGQTEDVLAYASKRATLIQNLMNEVSNYGIDGINVDLEFVGDELTDISEDNGEDYIEFIRELSIACRNAGVVLSVDVPVPFGNGFFHRKELGTVCDYVVIMGYDEHYDGSEEAGSVASIDYVKTGITDTLESVPANKLINGIPFYTRIWTTSADGTLDTQAGGMDWAKQYIDSNGISMNWDDTTCQNYGEATLADGSHVQIWMEDAESIEAKLGVMSANNLAGVAEWQLGYETPDIWDTIAAYMNS